MSNNEPSAIVLHGIPSIGGLYISFDSNGEIASLFAQVRTITARPRIVEVGINCSSAGVD